MILERRPRSLAAGFAIAGLVATLAMIRNEELVAVPAEAAGLG